MTNDLINYDKRETIETLKATVAKGATDAEFRMFTEICRATGLNPFKKEVWFIKAGDRPQIMTGIHGFYAIANGNSDFDGVEVGVIGRAGEYLPQTYPGNDYIGAWAKVYRKDRRLPTEGIAMLADYDKGSGNWRTMKRVMICKCAESVALRKAFPQQLNGLYTSEEMPTTYSEPRAEIAPEPIETKPLEPRFYRIANETPNQKRYMETRGVYMNDVQAWRIDKDLPQRELDKLEPHRITWEQLEAEKAQVVEPDVIEVESRESPLEKAKRRAAEMVAGEGK